MNTIVLFEPEIPQNVGNIIRTAMAFECNLVIIGHLKFTLDNKALARAKMDYATDFPIKFYDTYEEFAKTVKDKSKLFFVTRYSKFCYSMKDYSKKDGDYYFMFGRESTGIPYDILRENLDQCVRIPMTFNARSLNLSNCVAIIMSECLRQQNFNDLATTEVIKGEDFLTKE